MTQAKVSNIVFRKAERKRAKARIALAAPAGGGKTHSALKIAKGLGGKIAVIDTESGSAELEAGKAGIPDFDVITMNAPFDPIKYIAAIEAAENAGYDIVIIDSLTHAWAGTGGLLDKVDNISKSSKSGNSYTAWRDVTPLHNKLVEAILQSKCHIIATMRTKTDYILETNSKGGMQPKKVGMAPIQREGMDYEFTIVLDIDQASHVATATKDRTSLFDGTPFLPTEKTGEQILDWLNSGAEVIAPVEPEKPVAPVASSETVAPVENATPPTEPADFTERATIPQIDKLRARAKERAAVVDDANLVKYLGFMFNIEVAKVTDLSSEQVERALSEMDNQDKGVPDVE